MIRNTLMALSALSATASLAAPAFAEDSVTVHLAGKGPAAGYASVVKAAHAVCRVDRGSEIYTIFLADDCQKKTIAAALAKIGNPALSQFAADHETLLLTLAAN